jgi:tetratricopeptide (TPR) repeat protein
MLTHGELGKEKKAEIHSILYSYATTGDRSKAGTEIPSYLFTPAGLAYHSAGMGRVNEALAHYESASEERFSGAQWLAAQFAGEQERHGVIPEGRVETTFLRAIVLFREGQKRDAMPLFRRVASTDLVRREVAISLHILGNENSRGQREGAERELRRSIEIDRELKNPFGVAQTLHSLANMLAKEQRYDEAENAFRESVEIGEKLGNKNHLAQVLRSYGLATENRSPEEALRLLNRSLAINKQNRNRSAVQLVQRSIDSLRKRHGI